MPALPKRVRPVSADVANVECRRRQASPRAGTGSAVRVEDVVGRAVLQLAKRLHAPGRAAPLTGVGLVRGQGDHGAAQHRGMVVSSASDRRRS